MTGRAEGAEYGKSIVDQTSVQSIEQHEPFALSQRCRAACTSLATSICDSCPLKLCDTYEIAICSSNCEFI